MTVRKRIVAATVLLTLVVAGCSARTTSKTATALPDGKYLYVALGGTLHIYKFGTWTEVASYSIPTTDGIRGIDAAPSLGLLFIAYGSDTTAGWLLAWNMVTNTIAYNVHYSFGIDQPSYCVGNVYMPSGEKSGNSTWHIITASTGVATGTLSGGSGPHNTICHNGHVYMGGRFDNYLYDYTISTGTTISKGPSPSSQGGVRPFVVNANDARAYVTWTHYRGFSVADLTTGKIITSVNFGPVPSTWIPTSASHGISASGSEVYVLDAPYNQVRVYSEGDNPTLLATLDVASLSGSESPCAYDCLKEGWLLHSIDHQYVFVGDAGNIINTATRTTVATLSTLANSRHGYLEVDWSSGLPSATSTHFGIG